MLANIGQRRDERFGPAPFVAGLVLGWLLLPRRGLIRSQRARRGLFGHVYEETEIRATPNKRSRARAL